MTDRINASLLDLLIVFVISTSIISVVSLILSVFNVHTSVLLGVITTVSVFWIRKSTWKIALNLKSTHVLPIVMLLLIGLLFRCEPYNYIAGGQDEGVYVNMSKYFEDYGKIFVEDKVRKSLSDELKESYDTSNLIIGNRELPSLKGKIEGTYLPGVTVKNLRNSEYVFSFYELHPVWMSIFGKLFGNTHRVYSLVFFSLLSLVAFYLLAFEFTERKDLAFVAGALLAVNPLHAYFSKFPVTEVVALAFISLSFYYLLRYYKLAKAKVYFPTYLVLSALSMFGMFFTRISGFMYIPFFYAILIATYVFTYDGTLKKHFTYYVYSVFLLYALSVWYGLVYSYPYSIHIYETSFQRVLGNEWRVILPSLVGVLVVSNLAIAFTSSTNIYKRLLSSFGRVAPYLFLLALGLGLFKVYQLGFSDKYLGHPAFDVRWKASGKEWTAFLYWSVTVLIEYLSPFIAILFGYFLFSQAKKNNETRTMLVLFVLLIFAHISVLQWFISHQYYYARYLLSAAFPFVLLFSIISLDKLTKYKRVAYFLVGLSFMYMLFFTTMQFKGKEMDGLYSSLSEITKYVGQDDYLALDERWLMTDNAEIKTSLRFYFDLNVLTINSDDKVRFIDYFCSENKNIYFLNSQPNGEYEIPIKTIQVNTEIFARPIYIPTSIVHSSSSYYLSKASCNRFRLRKREKYQQNFTLYKSGAPLGEMKGFNDQVWTTATSSMSNIDIKVGGNSYIVLETFGWNPLGKDIGKLGLTLKVNNENTEYLGRVENEYCFSLPNINVITRLDISSNTFNPKEIGLSQDNRDLGIDIKSIKLVNTLDNGCKPTGRPDHPKNSRH